jgi:hypothetical protein
MKARGEMIPGKSLIPCEIRPLLQPRAGATSICGGLCGPGIAGHPCTRAVRSPRISTSTSGRAGQVAREGSIPVASEVGWPRPLRGFSPHTPCTCGRASTNLCAAAPAGWGARPREGALERGSGREAEALINVSWSGTRMDWRRIRRGMRLKSRSGDLAGRRNVGDPSPEWKQSPRMGGRGLSHSPPPDWNSQYGRFVT